MCADELSRLLLIVINTVAALLLRLPALPAREDALAMP